MWALVAASSLAASFAASLAGCGGSPSQPSPAPQPQPPVVSPPTPTPPPPLNAAPVITGLAAQGTRLREPANLADAGEEIVLTATVSDAETPIERLTFDWSSPIGTFSGQGPTVRWRAPSAVPAPVVVALQLRVVDGDQRVERSVNVRVHDHVREVGDMATQFLWDFSDTAIPVDRVMRNFLPGCYGTTDERIQVEGNRVNFVILAASVGPAQVTVDFDGTCPYDRKEGDACSTSRVRWESRKLNGETEIVEGTDQVAAVYRQDRWWLCDSSFDGRKVGGTSTGFLESLTRRRR